jgi:hypothetical protein
MAGTYHCLAKQKLRFLLSNSVIREVSPSEAPIAPLLSVTASTENDVSYFVFTDPIQTGQYMVQLVDMVHERGRSCVIRMNEKLVRL